MAWLVLVLSGAFEAVFAIALDRSQMFTRLVPTVVFLTAVTISMGGLAYAMRTLPVGTAYAVWVGVGASLTVAYSMATGEETLTVARLLLLVGLVGCIIGLKVVE